MLISKNIMFRKTEKIHFVGIGGVGMSGIAELLKNLGFNISGSDISESENVKRLIDLGCKITLEHKPENISGADVVVFSSAIKPNNPELKEAKKKKIPVIPRAEMLAELMRLKNGIAVAGTHGKTTTTSIIGNVLTYGGLEPTLIIGGKFFNISANAKLGSGQYLVCEADESDGSFLKLSPIISVVTNIDNDHLDYYKDFNNLKNAFIEYLNKVPFYGYGVICIDDKVIKSIIPKLEKRFYTYGIDRSADIHAKNLKMRPDGISYDLFFHKKFLTDINLSVQGLHNVQNSLAACAVCYELGLKIESIKEGLQQFKGVQRRLEVIGEKKGVLVMDDYGHHPTEIRATLSALKLKKRKRIIVIFQPHRYTRTSILYKEFGSVFSGANKLYLMEIYPAGEQPIPGVSSELIYKSIRKKGFRDIKYTNDRIQIANEIINDVKEGDLVLTLGAGNVYELAKIIYENL